MKERYIAYLARARALLGRNQVGERHDFGRSRDWLLGLGIAMLVTVMLLGVSLYTFFTSSTTAGVDGGVITDTSIRGDEERLSRVLEMYRARTDLFATLRQSPSPAPNPGGNSTSPLLIEKEDKYLPSEGFDGASATLVP